jgi:predicted transglutaminase-like protease
MLSDTFSISLPVKKILDYRLGICRDYARLTASLLFTVFPNSKIYFLTIPRHVAVAVKIKDNLYVLDQRLPVLTLEKWLMRWGQKKAKIFVSEVSWGSKGEPVEISFKRYDTANLTGFSDTTIVDTEKLTSELVYQLKISQVPEKGETEFEVALKNYAACYERDEIVTYSIVRAIKNRIECEFCSNVEKISKIKVEQRDKDLVVKVYLSENKI